MMRLIEDAIIKIGIGLVLTLIGIDIDYAPTVDIPEAIPIEWIRCKIGEHRNDGFAWIYEAILEDWRKEHETNRCR